MTLPSVPTRIGGFHTENPSGPEKITETGSPGFNPVVLSCTGVSGVGAESEIPVITIGLGISFRIVSVGGWLCLFTFATL
jgi:hypothetical protein